MAVEPTIIYNPFYVGGTQPRNSKKFWTWAQVRTVPYIPLSAYEGGDWGQSSGHGQDYTTAIYAAVDADNEIFRGMPRMCAINPGTFTDGTDSYAWWGGVYEDPLNPTSYLPSVGPAMDNDDAAEVLTNAVAAGDDNSVTTDSTSWDNSTTYGQNLGATSSFTPIGANPTLTLGP